MTQVDFLLVVRRKVCGCVVAAAVPGSAPARELERVFGSTRDYRVVPLLGQKPVVRCPHIGSPYYERNHPMTSTSPHA